MAKSLLEVAYSVASRAPVCTRCDRAPSAPYSAWCRACLAAYQRARRTRIRPSIEERARQRAGGKARYALKRGRLTREPCEQCGSLDVQMHHDNYQRPLDVRWLCAFHHRTLHKTRRLAAS